jgi:hypothetical protein
MTERGGSRAPDDDRDDTDTEADADGERDPEADERTQHLDDVEDGVGCTEIWERLSERREG